MNAPLPPSGHPVSGEDGAMLVEVVVGISLLAVVAAGLGGVHRSVVSSEARTAAQVLAVGLARETLVVTRGGGPTPAITDTTPTVEVDVREHPAATIDVGACAPPPVAADVVVHASPTLQDQPRVVRLPGVVPHRPHTEEAVEVRVAVAAATAERVNGGVIRSSDGTEQALVATGDACWRATLEPGTHTVELQPLDGTVLVGPTHLPHAVDAPLWPVTGPTTLPITNVAPAARVRVSADTGGARPPDEVGSGALRWLVRGDDARVATGLGDERSLHPGPTTVVVSACEHPEAQASTAHLVTVPDGLHDVSVPLATLRIDGIAGRTGASLVAIRTTGCADGATLRPALAWNGGLAEGIRVALPHGEWEVRLETPEGSRLTAPIAVLVDGSDAAVDLP